MNDLVYNKVHIKIPYSTSMRLSLNNNPQTPVSGLKLDIDFVFRLASQLDSGIKLWEAFELMESGDIRVIIYFLIQAKFREVKRGAERYAGVLIDV